MIHWTVATHYTSSRSFKVLPFGREFVGLPHPWREVPVVTTIYGQWHVPELSSGSWDELRIMWVRTWTVMESKLWVYSAIKWWKTQLSMSVWVAFHLNQNGGSFWASTPNGTWHPQTAVYNLEISGLLVNGKQPIFNYPASIVSFDLPKKIGKGTVLALYISAIHTLQYSRIFSLSWSFSSLDHIPCLHLTPYKLWTQQINFVI